MKYHTRDTQETNTALDGSFNSILVSVQDNLCAQFDWPFMKDRWEVTIAAGTRYKAIPTSNVRAIASTINFERPVQVYRFWQNKYLPIGYGIDIDNYNDQNSALSESQDPIQRWESDTNTGDTSNPDEFEVWPIPATDQVLRFEGQRVPRTFTSDSDKSELDSLLLALFAAAEVLQMRDQKLADAKQIQANRKLVACRAGIPSDKTPIILGRRQLDVPRIQRIPVAIA